MISNPALPEIFTNGVDSVLTDVVVLRFVVSAAMIVIVISVILPAVETDLLFSEDVSSTALAVLESVAL